MTCGGTGGHINPALAIADTIKTNMPGAVIEFVGTPDGKENDLIPREGYRLHHVRMTGLKRSLSPSNLKTLYYTISQSIILYSIQVHHIYMMSLMDMNLTYLKQLEKIQCI